MAWHHSPDPDPAPNDRSRVLAQSVFYPDTAAFGAVHDVRVQEAKAEH